MYNILHMNDLRKRDIVDLQKDIEETIKNLNIGEKREKLINLQNQTLEQNFWSHNSKAKQIMEEIKYIQEEINTAEELKNDIDTLVQIFNSITNETEQNQLIEEYTTLRKKLDNFELRKFLSGEYDSAPAIISIYSGQGGTESNDWVEMLFRMYTMYFDKKGWQYSVQEMEKGSEAGISTVTILVNQPLAFGILKKEHGTHRLVRISPFNAQGLRQTTFAGVEVLPVIEEDDSLEIPEKDILFKAVKAGGPGGQNVNKTSSAVQITHIPTNITVQSSNERSQVQNRENAMNILRAKLWRIKEEQRLSKISDIKGEYKVAGWGNQIRNYVLHPYKMVKDLRTGIELNDPESVLDGNIDELVEAEIRMQ
jgi:peptide chain release factor 2